MYFAAPQAVKRRQQKKNVKHKTQATKGERTEFASEVPACALSNEKCIHFLHFFPNFFLLHSKREAGRRESKKKKKKKKNPSSSSLFFGRLSLSRRNTGPQTPPASLKTPAYEKHMRPPLPTISRRQNKRRFFFVPGILDSYARAVLGRPERHVSSPFSLSPLLLLLILLLILLLTTAVVVGSAGVGPTVIHV